MLSRRLPRHLCISVVPLAALLCGCSSGHHSGKLDIPDMRHVSPSRADALSVGFSGAESDVARFSLNGPQGFELSGLPAAGSRLIVSSGYDYTIFCNGRLVPSQAKAPCRENNQYIYSEGCDYSLGVSAKMTVIRTTASDLYCEITPFFWRAYCNPHEEGDEGSRSHSHTYDGGKGCEWPNTQEFMFYLYHSAG